jgi:hypothetical protein
MLVVVGSRRAEFSSRDECSCLAATPCQRPGSSAAANDVRAILPSSPTHGSGTTIALRRPLAYCPASPDPMRTNLLLSLMTCVMFAACADHRGDLTAANAPQPPVNEPDPGSVGPGGSPPNTEPPGGGGGSGGGGGTGEGGGGTGTEGSGPVPEPSTLLLVGSGLACAAMLRRRRQAAAKV